MRELGARRIVFDGIDMLLAQLDDPAAERLELHRLHQWLYESGLSGIITAKTEQIDPHTPRVTGTSSTSPTASSCSSTAS